MTDTSTIVRTQVLDSSNDVPARKPAGLLSPTVMSLQLAGWMVFLCLWLPVCKGCGGGPDLSPLDFLEPVSVVSVKTWIFDVILLGSYCNGLVAAMLISATALLASERLWKKLFFVQFGLTSTIFTVMVLIGLVYSPDGKQLLGSFLFMAPTLTAYGAWIWFAVRRNDLQRAWARMQHSWTIATYFFIHLMIVLKGAVLIGYWITMLGLAGMVVAVEMANYRMKHDLWDSTQRVTRPQFAIKNILAWTAFFPITFSYFQAIDPFCNWVFKR